VLSLPQRLLLVNNRERENWGRSEREREERWEGGKAGASEGGLCCNYVVVVVAVIISIYSGKIKWWLLLLSGEE